MDYSDQEDFQTGVSAASTTFPKQCSTLRKNGFVMIKGHPCKIVDMTTSKTGKHGHAKVHLVGIDIFTAKKYEDLCPSTHNMDVPVVRKLELQFVCMKDDGILLLMDSNGNPREDISVEVNSENFKEIRAREQKEDQFTVCVQCAMDEKQVCGFKSFDA
ncbi:hypothetical protein HZS_915 [Henneguya salminicola]|uniref:Eukaryotic translation initiation factor 5A n=1 Tax=Henneguya salminicola TaxID=69463 RepID=A0A6G3MJL6_HENSL|nr:hypothetical protein HZS_915 [Henneguya salminicola]